MCITQKLNRRFRYKNVTKQRRLIQTRDETETFETKTFDIPRPSRPRRLTFRSKTRRDIRNLIAKQHF